jgi:hypothetical protein
MFHLPVPCGWDADRSCGRTVSAGVGFVGISEIPSRLQVTNHYLLCLLTIRDQAPSTFICDGHRLCASQLNEIRFYD